MAQTVLALCLPEPCLAQVGCCIFLPLQCGKRAVGYQFVKPLHRHLIFAVQERIRAQLIAQELLGFDHLSGRVLYAVQRVQRLGVVFRVHENRRQQRIYFVAVRRFGILFEERCESRNRLAQRGAGLVGCEGVVEHRLLARLGRGGAILARAIETHSRGISHLGRLFLAEGAVAVTQVQLRGLRDGIVQRFDLLERSDRVVVAACLVLADTQQVHILPHGFIALLGSQARVLFEVDDATVVLMLLIGYLAHDSVQLAAVEARVLILIAQQHGCSVAYLVVTALLVVDLYDIVRHDVLELAGFLHGQ